MSEPNFCPLIKKSCIKHDCNWYIHVIGVNPNTGQEINEWGCSITWMPLLLIKGAQETRQTGAAIESFRNEMVQIQNAIGHPESNTEQIENQESETAKLIS